MGGTVSVPFRRPMNAAPIGIFDSGIGGLTVARAIYERLPARVHRLLRRYGPGALRAQVAGDGDALQPRDPRLAAGAGGEGGRHRLQHQHRPRARRHCRSDSPVPVIGVIEPGARAAGAAVGGGARSA